VDTALAADCTDIAEARTECGVRPSPELVNDATGETCPGSTTTPMAPGHTGRLKCRLNRHLGAASTRRLTEQAIASRRVALSHAGELPRHDVGG
jgi:hypothetical protein